jgi:hypothetical protein
MRASVWCLTDMKGDRQTFIGLRDRAMLLFATSTAVCGESIRILRWSDMFVSEIQMDDVHMGLKVPVGDFTQVTCFVTSLNHGSSGPHFFGGQREAQPGWSYGREQCHSTQTS